MNVYTRLMLLSCLLVIAFNCTTSFSMADDPAVIKLSQGSKKELLVEVVKGKLEVNMSGMSMIFNEKSLFTIGNTNEIKLNPGMTIIIAKGNVKIKDVIYSEGTRLIIGKDGKCKVIKNS